ncbi:hypothetical protein BH20ACI4_BH20ACI4_34040 [soil metagenome]
MRIYKWFLAVLTMVILTVGLAFYVNLSFANNESCETAATCGKCGDGYCNPRCGENAQNCPKDCKLSPDRK